MITDAEAVGLLEALPGGSYLSNFAHYASFCTDAPMAYHLATGLAALATVAPSHLVLSMGQRTYGTGWFLLVGDSGTTKKTTTIDLMDRILTGVCPDRLGDHHGSVQSLYESLTSQPQQIIRYGEAGTFLSQSAQAGSPLAPIREAFMGLWDCRGVPYSTVKKRRSVIDPRLVLVMGCAPPLLDAHTTSFDWDNGFMARWIIVAAERERIYTLPLGVEGGEERLTALLLGRFQSKVGACTGITDEAFELYDAWYHDVTRQTSSKEIRAWAKSPIARVPGVALKVALMLSFDCGSAAHSNGHDWQLGLRELQWGIRFAEMHLSSVLHVVENIAGSIYARRRRSVVSVFQTGEALALGQILARVQPELDKRTLVGVLETMQEAQQLFQVGIAGGPTLFTLDPLVAPGGTIGLWQHVLRLKP